MNISTIQRPVKNLVSSVNSGNLTPFSSNKALQSALTGIRTKSHRKWPDSILNLNQTTINGQQVTTVP